MCDVVELESKKPVRGVARGERIRVTSAMDCIGVYVKAVADKAARAGLDF